jgi:transcriptional/translational regulatory protein YebC/TACO1
MATKKEAAKTGKVMREYKEGTLHSGKGGKVVTNPKQAIAIALSEAKNLPKRGQRTAINKGKK